MNTKRMLTGAGALALLLVLMLAVAGCTGTTPGGNATTTATPAITTGVTTVPTTYTGPRTDLLIATTTSLEDTGLLDNLTPIYEATHPVNLKITSQGTGLAIQLAKRGDADLLLVHSPTQEAAFMEQGYGVNRRGFAYNYFNIVGPASDPAGIKGLAPEAAFAKIANAGKGGNTNVVFVSRGDNSGTSTAEIGLWGKAGFNYTKDIQNSGPWYLESGKGMGDTLLLASEKNAYTLTDEGTFLAYKSRLNLEQLVTQGSSLLNLYSAMAVIPKNNATATIQAANDYIDFLISPQGQQLIADYGKDKYGKGLFNPMTPEKAKELSTATNTIDATTPATATKPVLVYAAGSLASPFAQLKKSFDANNTDSELGVYTGASVTMIEKITKAGQKADVLASADAYLIPKLMYPNNASWMLSFARNAEVIAFNNTTSAYDTEITADNWYDVLQRQNVSYAISDPTSDPGGYRALMLVKLAESRYNRNNLFQTLIGDHSKITTTTSGGVTTIDVSKPTPDGTTLVIPNASQPSYINQLKSGAVDYIFTYRSNAVQNGFAYLTLPPEIDLSDPAQATNYATVQVKRPDGSTEAGMPIEYGITVPSISTHPDQGRAFVKLLTGPEGTAVLRAQGFTPISPPAVNGTVPSDLAAA